MDPLGPPRRVVCLAPGCRRTTTRLDPHHDEFICAKHWQLVPRKLKRLRTRARRRRLRDLEARIWRRIRERVLEDTLMGFD